MGKYDFGMPLQPGEASWISWKCDGGPHISEYEPPRATVPLTRSIGRTALTPPLPYSGTETSPLDWPAKVTVPNGFRANLPA